MTTYKNLSSHDCSGHIHVEVVPATAINPSIRHAWLDLRERNPELWSPYFDLRMFDILASFAPYPRLAVIRQQGEIVALLPFQGKIGGLARPLGAPLSDQHSVIHAADTHIKLADILKHIGMAGFVFTGMRHTVPEALKLQESICHVADLSEGVDAYIAWRKLKWKDHVKKSERRIRQGERQWGPMRLETACPKTSNQFETLIRWKQAKYIETNRHNILAVPWIRNFLHCLYLSNDADFSGEITSLYFGDHLVALEYGLRSGDVMHSWFPAFDRAYAQISPGILLMDGMIEMCGRRGITRIDLGTGHDQYKCHASNAPFPVWSGTLPVTALRRASTQAFINVDLWLETKFPTRFGKVLGRLERRSEMILAAEPTFLGRLGGYVDALKAFG